MFSFNCIHFVKAVIVPLSTPEDHDIKKAANQLGVQVWTYSSAGSDTLLNTNSEQVVR